ncbi:TPA: glutamate 5-kinase [Legionella pneumophila]|nr:glutamate 5-kinase [Legionella pneumophila]HAT3975748.1 glutamate 5-kinase [Legionella pneumophila]HAT3977743.1 glutamate 5-kinase [Legionella pneumophila]HAT8357637.1 glutamate 5-kinase [Legionella pneumophila]HAT8358312.1 glutamate 5-kinase [Legionella pneumophila]HAU1206800.1 glutamate 5-kinase [Legionella pneumophila]
MKIIIKVGTQSILSADGSPIYSVLNNLVNQIIYLKNLGHQVILVSSGAVGSGRKIVKNYLEKTYGDTVGEKQLLASIGQPELMNLYSNLFKNENILVSQLLLTKQDFHTRQHYLNIARLLTELLKHQNIIPIVNENDSVAIEELMFTDNDELAGLIAAQINADFLILLTNVDGVFTSHPNDPEAKLINTIDPNLGWPNVSAVKSKLGRGGMVSKLDTARKMAGLGINTAIANVNVESIVLKILDREAVGTIILASKRKSSIKRWIAFSHKTSLPSIVINDNLITLLRNGNRVMSILPIGIEDFRGECKKGDLIDILNSNNEKIGVGIARYDFLRLKDYLRLQNKPAFIHYDHLHIL